MHCTSSNFTKYVVRVVFVLVAHHLRIVGVAGARGRLLAQALEAIQVGLCRDDKVIDARVEDRSIHPLSVQVRIYIYIYIYIVTPILNSGLNLKKFNCISKSILKCI